jgi:tetratricopeptide (TPR) repeat protein
MVRSVSLIVFSSILVFTSDTDAQPRQSPGQSPGAQFTIPLPFDQRTTPEQDVEQAKKLEQLGQLEQAAALYERVLLRAPLHAQALNALPRLYLRLQRYDRAITLLKGQVDRSPNNTVFRSQLADALFQAKQPEEARRHCRIILEQHRTDESVIRMVAALYTNYGQYPDAVETYQKGRAALGRPGAFAQSLAALYTTMSDVPGAVAEYVRWLNAEPDRFPEIDDYMEALSDLQGPGALEQALAKAATLYPSSKEVCRLMGNFYLRQDRPAEGLAQYRKADQLDGSKGVYLLEFSAWAAREEHHGEAIDAYTGMMNTAFPAPVQAQAAVGLAKSYETLERFEEALVAYQTAITRFPKTRAGEEAMFRTADLMLTYRRDPQAALTGFRALLSAAPRSAFQEEAMFRIADCHVARGSIRDAIGQYNQILDPASGLTGDLIQARAKFGLAEMELFRDQIDEALTQFTAVASAYTGSQYANDALKWVLLIGEARRSGDEAAKTYIQAALLRRQFKPQAAMDACKQILSDYPGSPIGDLVVLDIGLLLDELGKPHEAIAAFRDLIVQYPESRYAVEAQRHIAEVYERRLYDIPKAIAEYETILTTYPDHFQNDLIRRKIRQLAHQRPLNP